MELADVKKGVKYFCKHNDAVGYVIGCYYDDGAALIIELVKGGDTTGELRSTEACFLRQHRPLTIEEQGR